MTLLERLKSIFEFLDQQPRALFKSDLRTIGINPEVAQRYIDIIEYIQSQRKMRVTRTKNNVIIELDSKQDSN